MGDSVDEVVWPPDGTQQAILTAAGACMARWGVTKTTIADLATEAGCSRATVYRVFPGGKSQIMAVYGLFELRAFFDDVTGRVDEAETLEDALVDVITTAARGLAGHLGFQFMLTHEPGLALPYLGFTNIDRLYGLAADALAPSFERLAPQGAYRLVELAARITLSHIFQPSNELDLSDAEHVRGLVRHHLLPVAHTQDLSVPAPLAVPA